jgi:release factor glutamine methyltransferase
MTLGDLQKKITEALKLGEIESADLEARWILESVMNIKPSEVITYKNVEINENKVKLIDAVVEDRLKGRPLAYVLQKCEFYGLEFNVREGVLIPRPETEILVEWALDKIAEIPTKTRLMKVLDMGAGSGCIGLSIYRKAKSVDVTAVEKSKQAMKILEENYTHHKFGPKVNTNNHFLAKNSSVEEFLSYNKHKYEVILANPPYIANDDKEVDLHVLKYEPHEALFAGEFGIELIVSWIQLAARHLAKSAIMGFEIGHKQSHFVLDVFKSLDLFDKVYTLNDLHGKNRFVCGEKKWMQ